MGIIASFSIFILFLVGIFLVLEPAVENNKNRALTLEFLELKLTEEFSAPLTSVILKHNETECLSISDSNLEVYGFSNSLVKDSSGNILNSQYNSQILTIETNPSGVLFVYYSNESFLSSTTAETGCGSPDIESIREEEKIFSDRIINATQNVDLLKRKFGIESYNFEIIFTMENGTIISSNGKNFTGDIYSSSLSVDYLDKNASINSGEVTIKIY